MNKDLNACKGIFNAVVICVIIYLAMFLFFM